MMLTIGMTYSAVLKRLRETNVSFREKKVVGSKVVATEGEFEFWFDENDRLYSLSKRFDSPKTKQLSIVSQELYEALKLMARENSVAIRDLVKHSLCELVEKSTTKS